MSDQQPFVPLPGVQPPRLPQVRPLPCVYLGADTGTVCTSCPTQFKPKIYQCHHPAHTDGTIMVYCARCPDYLKPGETHPVKSD